jgi:hypothetical protein
MQQYRPAWFAGSPGAIMIKAAALLLFALALPAAAKDVYVQPHVTKNGTYIEGHHRAAPNQTVEDNYGTKGNYNPYTGQSGTQPRSYEQPTQAPIHTPRTYGQQCGYTSAGQYVCR